MALLELLIAIAIFSLVAATAYAALSQGLLVQDRLQEQRRFWQRFEAVFNLVHADLEQAVDLAPGATGSHIFTGYEQGDSAEYAQMVEFNQACQYCVSHGASQSVPARCLQSARWWPVSQVLAGGGPAFWN